MINLKQVTVSITEQQEKFLKLFAEKQYHGAPDNRCTSYPIHFVETKRYRYIPYSDDIAWAFDDKPLSFTSDSDYDRWYTSEVETVIEWYENRGEDCLIEIKPFKEIECKEIKAVNGEDLFITDYFDYFKAYGVHIQAIAWREEYYEKVAPFFILEEAKRYMKYQGHNLHSPRVYTYGMGYGDQGEYGHFWELLMTIGKQLNQVEQSI
ncbi:hypothetical protein [Brevibacillus massiliensis]|uniref:hypothetical protein n=1 Tax=Brevibacillus massiliensis TaxID=1118054 RepID=UPI0036F2D37E